MFRTPRTRSLLAALAAASVLVGLIACGPVTFQNELPIYDAAFADIDAALPEPDAGPVPDAGDAGPALDGGDASSPHDGGDGGDGGSAAQDGGDASFDAHFDAE